MLYASTVLMPHLTASAANPINRLIMPGPVIEGHAEFEDDCQSCHTRFQRGSESTRCRDCHDEIDADMKEERGYHGHSPDVQVHECRDCHTDHEGRDANIAAFDARAFEHSLTDFPLLGAHSGGECESCHPADTQFRAAPSRCVGCHADDDKHHGELGEQCTDCHTQRAWTEARFDHDQTDWPLLGKHAAVECDSCHVEQQYADTPTECAACHRDDDDHRGQFGRQCESCHVAHRWTLSVFDHARDTGYALDGGHRDVSCSGCHSAPLYERKPDQACQSCHRDDDVHDRLRGQVCANCHVVAAWDQTDFDHLTISGYALRGRHADAPCESCHLEPADMVDLPQDCYGCHQDDDPHRGQQGQRCEQCHSERDWTADVTFDHALTVFPLLGRHAEAQCDQCHASSAFRDAPSACVECHLEDDVHGGSLGTLCADCHTPDNWDVWQFEHGAATGFSLTGAHASASCASCHTGADGGRIASPPDQCNDCHATDDVHFGEFGRRCERCHSTDTFRGARAVRH